MTVDELIERLSKHRGTTEVRVFAHAGLVPHGYWQENGIDDIEMSDDGAIWIVAES